MFERVISLGWFCSVALEIKRIGLRDGSYPFDWLLTHNFSKVLDIMNAEVDSIMFLKNEDMLQYEGDASKWYNKRYQISLFHDFDKYKKMISQLDMVNKKYQRRVKRLQECVDSTLYIRYVKDQEEALYITANETRIDNIIKKRNASNDIIYIAHPNLQEAMKQIDNKVYFIENDEGDYVSREFLKKLPELESYLLKNVKKPPIDYYEKNPSNNKRIIGYRFLKKIESKLRKQAANDNLIHQNGVLENCENEDINLIIDKSQCSGCGVCQELCPVTAIEMKEIDEFYYPVIDNKKCIRCHQCLRICPFKS